MARRSTTQTGDAGEYAAAAELAVRGWTVDLPRRNQQGIDLYAYHRQQLRTVGVQVKTRLPRSRDFRFDGSLLDAAPDVDSWVVLVALAAPGTRSKFVVVPRQHITGALRTFHDMMRQRGKEWTARYLGTHEFKQYEEQWDLMQYPSANAPEQLSNVVDLAMKND